MRVLSVRKKAVLAVLFLIIMSLSVLSARTTGAKIMNFPGPFLITSGGQGPGSKMMRILLVNGKNLELGEDFFLEDEPKERLDEIASRRYNTIVIVMGVTDKGLAASGITIEEELENLSILCNYAKSWDIPVIAILFEAMKGEDIDTYAKNDRVVDLVVPYASWIIVKKDSNVKNRFNNLSKQYDIPLTLVDSVQDIVGMFPKIFKK